jgi:hypothetical protein
MRPSAWVLLIILALSVGVIAGRTWWPREVTIPVDREVQRVVERVVPGIPVVIERPVPGPTEIVRVPVEVVRTVPGPTVPGPERIVTVTQPVHVPMETIRDRWPQTITVTVGGVQSGGQWYAPDVPTLVIGQVTPGVYAVSDQSPGWRVERVETSTVMPPTPAPPSPSLPYHLSVSVGAIGGQAWAGVTYQHRIGPALYQLTAGYGFPGFVGGVALVLPIR